MFALVDVQPTGLYDSDSIILLSPNRVPLPTAGVLCLVDLKGIEPSNLTDANRALSQLSYKPIFRCISPKKGGASL